MLAYTDDLDVDNKKGELTMIKLIKYVKIMR